MTALIVNKRTLILLEQVLKMIRIENIALDDGSNR